MTAATAAADERERCRRNAEAMARVAVAAHDAADAMRRCMLAFEAAAVALRTLREIAGAGKGK